MCVDLFVTKLRNKHTHFNRNHDPINLSFVSNQNVHQVFKTIAVSKSYMYVFLVVAGKQTILTFSVGKILNVLFQYQSST